MRLLWGSAALCTLGWLSALAVQGQEGSGESLAVVFVVGLVPVGGTVVLAGVGHFFDQHRIPLGVLSCLLTLATCGVALQGVVSWLLTGRWR